jgi:purine-binding chemotaxis protein CheW
MSENEDERLDRAKRIRKMREGDGSRSESDEETEAADAPEADETVSGDSPEDDSGESAEAGGDSTGDVQTNADTGVSENTQSDESSAETQSDDDTDEPEAVVPETTDLESEQDEDALEPDDDVRAPLPETEELEEALESSGGDASGAGPEEVAEPETAAPSEALDEDGGHEEETRVLEFQLGGEYYCLDIDYIEEIVKDETITRVPNTPDYVEGVVDLRGQITTILNPKVTIGKDDVNPGELIIVFDSDSFEDQGHMGWVVDDVRQVSPITDNEVNEPPVQKGYINGVIDREGDEQFVIWTNPDMAMEEAE